MPRTESSNWLLETMTSSALDTLSTSIMSGPFRFCAAYLSIAPDCFLRKAVDLGLSNVETEDPETSEGVRMLVGAGVAAADGVADNRRAGILEGAAAAACVGGRLVLLEDDSVGVMLLLARFANFDTCCKVLFCLFCSMLVLLVGIRLVCFGCNRCWSSGSVYCDLNDDMARGRRAQHS